MLDLNAIPSLPLGIAAIIVAIGLAVKLAGPSVALVIDALSRRALLKRSLPVTLNVRAQDGHDQQAVLRR